MERRRLSWAMHKGIGKGGERLYPAFPYESYTLLTDQDVLAIKAYLFSLPKVSASVPANHLVFPFNQRRLMGLWSLAYNPNERFHPRSIGARNGIAGHISPRVSRTAVIAIRPEIWLRRRTIAGNSRAR